MSTAKPSVDSDIPSVTEEEQLYRDARRTDLAFSIGIIVSPPPHGPDASGRWHYGLPALDGLFNQEVVDEFKVEADAIVSDVATSLAARGVIPHEAAQALRGAHYSVGPAGQEWPQFLYMFWQDVRPFINDGASLIEWAAAIGWVLRRFQTWSMDTYRAQMEEFNASDGFTCPQYELVRPDVTVTQGGVIALCYADLVERHGIAGDITITTYPRGFPGVTGPEHPSSGVNYLVSGRSGRRNFVYHVDGRGNFTEHYLITGSDITLLPLSSGKDDWALIKGVPLPGERIQVKKR